MKLSDFSLLDEEATDELHEFIQRLNQTQSDYPRHKTTHQLFMEQAAKTPTAIAVLCGEKTLTYAELDRQSNRLAHFLVSTGVVAPESFVGVMLDRSLDVVVALLGILKAGAAYLPIQPTQPFERIKYMLADAQVPLLISEKRYIKQLNKLQWECPDLRTIFCIDSHNIHAEIEETSDMMDMEVWNYVAQEAVDDISGGGWVDSYTGELLSRQVMDDYGDNIVQKLMPYLNSGTRILEIGCASGISMFRLAPHVGTYVGTDLSPGIIEWSQQEADRRGLHNIQLHCLAAHEIDQLQQIVPEKFDLIILNSVIECFSGHNYLRDVLGKSLDLLADKGMLFLGNLWDQDKKEEFVQSLLDFKKAHVGQGYRTKTDRSDELCISRSFLEDLRHDFPAIAKLEFSAMLGESVSELSLYGFDALVFVEKGAGGGAQGAKHKWQVDRRALEQFADERLVERSQPRGLAYLMYTSGTSGQPKGVMIEHRSIVRLVMKSNFINFTAADRTLQAGALAFDASTFELWGPLLNGGGVCLPEGNALLEAGELAELIKTARITAMFLTAGLFNQLVDVDPTIFQGMTTLLVGGEQVSTRHMNAVRRACPEVSLKNGYGPTENTTFTTYFPVDRLFEGTIPIGFPLANTTVYVLDEALQLTPLGTPGELCTGGDGLARGYLNAPELTQAKFVDLPFAPFERVYRTGDQVRQLADGSIEYLGRLDNQVKIRGYRIELGEIEQTLLQEPAIKECALVVRQSTPESKELAAYLVADTKLEAELEIDSVRHFLRSKLPEYMIPSYFIKLDKLPLNQNGKVDRRRLPAPEAADVGRVGRSLAPQSATEIALHELWSTVMGRQQIGVTDDFFDIGGHSLKASKLVSLIHQKLGISIPLVTIFQAPTIRQLAQVLLDRAQFSDSRVDEVMTPLNNCPQGPRIFAFPPGTGDAAGYLQLAELLKPFAVYGFNFIEDANRLEIYADRIQQQDPLGPYLLFGYSGGGNLAYHVAKVLEGRSKVVSAVVMVDASRRLAPVPQDSAQVDEIVGDFLQHESIRPLLTTPLLSEKLGRRIRASYDYYSTLVDRHTIQAPIHLLLCEDDPADYHDEQGRLLASTTAWAEATQSSFATCQGVGQHINMLIPPYLGQNAALVKGMFESVMRDA